MADNQIQTSWYSHSFVLLIVTLQEAINFSPRKLAAAAAAAAAALAAEGVLKP